MGQNAPGSEMLPGGEGSLVERELSAKLTEGLSAYRFAPASDQTATINNPPRLDYRRAVPPLHKGGLGAPAPVHHGERSANRTIVLQEVFGRTNQILKRGKCNERIYAKRISGI